MREILFRGKRVDNGEWVYGGLNIINHSPFICYEMLEGLPEIKEVTPQTVGQYTGLTDKNGNKIFEGDIIPVYEQGEEYYYKVVYNGDCFMLAMFDSEQGSYPLSTKNAISEAIGNIHDNLELLKGGGEFGNGNYIDLIETENNFSLFRVEDIKNAFNNLIEKYPTEKKSFRLLAR